MENVNLEEFSKKLDELDDEQLAFLEEQFDNSKYQKEDEEIEENDYSL